MRPRRPDPREIDAANVAPQRAGTPPEPARTTVACGKRVISDALPRSINLLCIDLGRMCESERFQAEANAEIREESRPRPNEPPRITRPEPKRP